MRRFATSDARATWPPPPRLRRRRTTPTRRRATPGIDALRRRFERDRERDLVAQSAPRAASSCQRSRSTAGPVAVANVGRVGEARRTRQASRSRRCRAPRPSVSAITSGSSAARPGIALSVILDHRGCRHPRSRPTVSDSTSPPNTSHVDVARPHGVRLDLLAGAGQGSPTDRATGEQIDVTHRRCPPTVISATCRVGLAVDDTGTPGRTCHRYRGAHGRRSRWRRRRPTAGSPDRCR